MKNYLHFRSLIILSCLITVFGSDIIAQPMYSVTGGTTSNTIPLSTAATSSNRRMWIFYPSNFPTATSGMITKIYIGVNGTPSSTFTNFTVKMGNTALSAFTAGPFITAGMDTTFFSPSFSVSAISGNWLPITLNTPFYYDGTSNFIVDIAHYGFTTGISIMQGTYTGRSLFGNAAAASASLQDRLVNFGFDIQPVSQKTDAGITAGLSPADSICAGQQGINVSLKNFGPNAMTSVKIGCKINNDTLTTFNWTGNLAVNATTNVNLGTYNFISGTPYSFSAYTKLPNNLTDTFSSNDTFYKPTLTVLPSFTGTLTPSATVSFCNNDSVLATLTAPTANSWQWYSNGQVIPGAVSSSYYIKQAGSYSVWFSNGICSRFSDTLVASSVPAPPANISTYTPTTFCQGDSVFLFANAGTGLAYEWKLNNVTIPGATASTYAAKLGGIYTVVVSIPGSCSTTSAPVTVTLKPNHPVDLGPDKTVCGNAIVSLDAGSGANTYLWSTGAQTQTINVDSSGVGYGNKIITVITTKDSCASYDTVSITFIDCTGIEDLGQQQYIRVFPNPGKGDFSIELPIGITHGTVELRDFSGRLVYKEDFHSTSKSGLINLKTGLLAGVYILSINIHNHIYKEKLIIQ